MGLLAGSPVRPRGGSALLMFPGVGQVAIFGPLVHELGGALASADAALGCAPAAGGLARECVPRYDSAIRHGRLVVLAHGWPGEVSAVRRLLAACGATEMHGHAIQPAQRAAPSGHAQGCTRMGEKR